VELAGGISNFSPMIGSNASQLMKNLQQLIASNPEYLTSGIPTHLIQQMWKKEDAASTAPTTTTSSINNPLLQSKVMMNKNLIMDVRYNFIIFFLFFIL
jgi:hypothetical protein